MELTTERLLLRPWRETDAADLFEYAKDPAVGPIAGWPVHQSIEDSLFVIQNVLGGSECYAVCLKEDGRAIGCMIPMDLQSHSAAVQVVWVEKQVCI